MKAIVAYVCIAVGLVLASAILLAAGLLDRNMARAEQSVSALHYDQADRDFAASERYLQYESRLPWIGNGPVNDVRTRRAEIRYWQRQYAALIAQQADGGNGAGAENVGLQLVAANAAFRAGQMRAKDRQTMLQAIDSGIQANLGILKNTTRQDDAAYNYEYLTRLRDEILDGRGSVGSFRGHGEPNGAAGEHVMDNGDSKRFKVIAPETKEERQRDGGAGKVLPAQRKG